MIFQLLLKSFIPTLLKKFIIIRVALKMHIYNINFKVQKEELFCIR